MALKRLEFDGNDLRDYPLPLFAEPMSPAYAPPANEVARRWSAKAASMDGFIFVTAEYNHGPTAAVKNALDHLYHEVIELSFNSMGLFLFVLLESIKLALILHPLP